MGFRWPKRIVVKKEFQIDPASTRSVFGSLVGTIFIKLTAQNLRSFIDQLRAKLHNLEAKDQSGKGGQLGGQDRNCQGRVAEERKTGVFVPASLLTCHGPTPHTLGPPKPKPLADHPPRHRTREKRLGSGACRPARLGSEKTETKQTNREDVAGPLGIRREESTGVGHCHRLHRSTASKPSSPPRQTGSGPMIWVWAGLAQIAGLGRSGPEDKTLLGRVRPNVFWGWTKKPDKPNRRKRSPNSSPPPRVAVPKKNNSNLVMGQVKILKRGKEDLIEPGKKDETPRGSHNTQAVKSENLGFVSTDMLGPDAVLVPTH
ncbi:hypothetical protein NC653_037447 [Populus alba x Populus x berolinensis]|uniref:Uncharacterized protein n=1 Tax=Populus alba x Populus x berolinensis TaxID=444605 RepID=A0AAD6LGZ7_9ROSI|nr:hypothetical protein NC653_037447 [Populus alba x Populus x berolinensis]